jgi:cobalt/nickel transport system permease protein
MHHEYLDRYARSSSPVHRLRAIWKVVAAVAIIVLVVLSPVNWTALFMIVVCALGVIVALSKIPLRFVLTRLLFAEPFIIGVGLLTLFQPTGVLVFLKIAVKGNICVLTMVLLSNTTPFSSLLVVLQRMKVPHLFISILALMYRYIFLLVDQANRMRIARRSRTMRRGRLIAWRSGAGIVGQLFIRSMERAERVYVAMTARGWQ